MTKFSSGSATEPAVFGDNTNTKGGDGLVGHAQHGRGVRGESEEGTGVLGVSVSGKGRGVEGFAKSNYGVYGESTTFPGVRGTSTDGRAVEGWSTNNSGVWGISTNATGVEGISEGGGDGVVGTGHRGVVGKSPTYQGVYGWSGVDVGVVGESQDSWGVFAISHGKHAGLYATNKGGALAANLDGNVNVARDLRVFGDVLLSGADVAEEFSVLDGDIIAPGMVMVLADDEGVLRPSDMAYDRRVAGVIAGGGEYRSAIVMDRREGGCRRALALVGKTYCQVDATSAPIAVGDLLTTSQTPGSAMKASDAARAFGAVIGKALRPLRRGSGLIPILVTLQ